MDTGGAIFWFVVITCISGLVVSAIRLRRAAAGWISLYVGILLVAGAGKALNSNILINCSLGTWLLLVLAPALLSRAYYKSFLQQRYAKAEQLARFISWLHPADGWPQQPEILRALELARRGEITEAQDILARFKGTRSTLGLAAVTNLFRITNQWEELLEWQKFHVPNPAKHPALLPVLMRAFGETGDLRGMIAVYDRNKQRISKMVPASARDLCRLILFAFCGRQAAVAQLLEGNLAILPPSAQQFWLATAEQAAGNTEAARQKFEALLPVTEPAVRSSIERRLSRLSSVPQPLPAEDTAVLDDAEREHGHDEQFGAARSLFSRRAWATQLLIAVNVVMFLIETRLGGTMNPETLYRLGALFPPAVHAGQVWRLGSSLFLHMGTAHLVMNMFALWVLGPFMEFALGPGRYLVLYLISGIGSMGTVILLASGQRAEQITIGASGCIMGLVGATGALMLRAWRRHKVSTAKRRLLATAVIILMQTTFDSLIPQVSM